MQDKWMAPAYTYLGDGRQTSFFPRAALVSDSRKIAKMEPRVTSNPGLGRRAESFSPARADRKPKTGIHTSKLLKRVASIRFGGGASILVDAAELVP
jgi:hypothetical protein